MVFLLVCQLMSLPQGRLRPDPTPCARTGAEGLYLLEAVPQELLVFRVAEIHNVLPQKLLIFKGLGEMEQLRGRVGSH